MKEKAKKQVQGKDEKRNVLKMTGMGGERRNQLKKTE